MAARSSDRSTSRTPECACSASSLPSTSASPRSSLSAAGASPSRCSAPPARRRDEPHLLRGARPFDPGRGEPGSGRRPAASDREGDARRSPQSTPISHGVDFGHVGQVLLVVFSLYLGSSVAGYFQARLTAMVGQRSVQRLRAKVQAKLARLPLSYFDRVRTARSLSRVTNDIDNISQTLQQTLSQIVTSLLTIVGVLVMMLLISPLLAVIALVTVPVSIFVATRIGKAAQPHFLKQWRRPGS